MTGVPTIDDDGPIKTHGVEITPENDRFRGDYPPSMPAIRELETTGSVEELIRRRLINFYNRTQSFYMTVVRMATVAGRCREYPLLYPWLVLEHCLRVGVDAVIEFGWVSQRGTHHCAPHIWVETDHGILDPVMLSLVMVNRLTALDIVYHEEVPLGYGSTDDEILFIERFAYEHGLQNYIFNEIQHPDTRTAALALCNLSDQIAPFGDITL